MALSEKKSSPGLNALKAFFDEAADSFLAGYGDELSAALETPPLAPGLIDKQSYGERFKSNLERRQAARTKMQDENIAAGTLGALSGMTLSPMARVTTLPVRMATSALEEAGRSDPQSALEYLKALAVGAGQGVSQHVLPQLAADAQRLRRGRSIAPVYTKVLDAVQSNIAPGLFRKAEADRKQREEEEERIKNRGNR